MAVERDGHSFHVEVQYEKEASFALIVKLYVHETKKSGFSGGMLMGKLRNLTHTKIDMVPINIQTFYFSSSKKIL